jgi:hypothetical protein
MGGHSIRMNDIVNQLEDEKNRIDQAISLLSGGGSTRQPDDRSFNTSSSNRGTNFRSRFRGNRNIDGSVDGRTQGGREEYAEENYDFDLQSAMQQARINVTDGSIDMRDRAGRWLHAEGYIDNDGFPASQEAEQAFEQYHGHNYDQGGNYTGSRGSGRSFGEAASSR